MGAHDTARDAARTIKGAYRRRSFSQSISRLLRVSVLAQWTNGWLRATHGVEELCREARRRFVAPIDDGQEVLDCHGGDRNRDEPALRGKRRRDASWHDADTETHFDRAHQAVESRHSREH